MQKYTIAVLFLLFALTLGGTAEAANADPKTAPDERQEDSSGGPYGLSGFSGSGYSGNGFYGTTKSTSHPATFPIPAATEGPGASSANGYRNQTIRLELIGLAGLAGLFGLWRVKKRLRR